MKVFTTQPFQAIYSLFEHEYLGFLFESFVVQVNSRGQLTLQHQNISAKNADEFASRLDAEDFKLIPLIDQIQQDAIYKQFGHKKLSLTDFFLKTFDPEKGDKTLQETILRYVQSRMAKILDLLANKKVFIMGKDGEPTWKEIKLAEEKATVLFHFQRNEENTHYFPTIKYQGQKLEFQYKDAALICNEPAWLLLENRLYSFEKEVDGKKLQPFLHKNFIVIPRKVEETYFTKFVAPLVESFDVYAKGFEIKSERYQPQPHLTFTEVNNGIPAKDMFHGKNSTAEKLAVSEKILFNLAFQYGKYTVLNNETKRISVNIEKTQDSYIFHRLIRDVNHEKEFLKKLSDRELEVKNGKAVLDKS